MQISPRTMDQFEQMLNQKQWSVFYINNWSWGDCDKDTVNNLSFTDAVKLIRTLPKKWATYEDYKNPQMPDFHFYNVTQHSDDAPPRELGDSERAVSMTGPYLSYGAPQSWRGECEVGCELQQLTFTKDKILSIVDLD